MVLSKRRELRFSIEVLFTLFGPQKTEIKNKYIYLKNFIEMAHELFDPNFMLTKITYAGMLTQDGFKQRYLFIRTRIAYGYTRDELAFLLGKPISFINDYEELEGSIHMNTKDLETLTFLFISPHQENMTFDKDDYNYSDKRLIRGCQETKDGVYLYTFEHPWMLDKVNTPYTFQESIVPYEHDEDETTRYMENANRVISYLIKTDFFKIKRLPTEIYKKAKEICYSHQPVRPIYLKEKIFDLIHNGQLKIQRFEHQVFYVNPT